MSTYASFQGRVYLGKRDAAGNPTDVRSPGNVAELKLSLKTEVLEHFESQTGQRSLDHRMVKQKSATIMLTIEEFTKENLALALYGSFVQSLSGNVQAQPIAAPILGDRFLLAHPKVSALVVKDSALPPITLALGVDYTAELDFGGALCRADQSRVCLWRNHRNWHLYSATAGALFALGRAQYRTRQRQGAGRAVPRRV